MLRKLPLALTAAAALLMASTGAYAAGQNTQGQGGSAGVQAQGQASHPHYSHAQLKKFVHAYKDISQIRSKYSQKIKGAQNASKVKSMQHRANNAMVAAIRHDGLSVGQYSQIAHSVQSDPQLRNKITSMLKND